MQPIKSRKNSTSNFKQKFFNQQKQKFLDFFKLQKKFQPSFKVFQIQDHLNKADNFSKHKKAIKFSKNLQRALPNDFFRNSKSQRCSVNKKIKTFDDTENFVQLIKAKNIRKLQKFDYKKINTLENQFNGQQQIIRYRKRENLQQSQKSLNIKNLKKFKYLSQNDQKNELDDNDNIKTKKVMSCRTSVGKSKEFYENLKHKKYFQEIQNSFQFKKLPKTAQTAQNYSPQKEQNLYNLTFGNNFHQAFQRKMNSQQLSKIKYKPIVTLQQNLQKNQFMEQSIKNRFGLPLTTLQMSQFHIKQKINSNLYKQGRERLLTLSKIDNQVNSHNFLKMKTNLLKTLEVKQTFKQIKKVKLPKIQ